MVARAKPRSQTRARTVHPDLTKGGNNGPDFTTISLFYHKLRRAEDKHKETGDEMKAVKKQMQNAGVVMEDFALTVKFIDMDTANAVAKMKRIKHYAAALGSPFAQQMELFSNPADAAANSRQKAMDSAYQYGRFTGSDMEGGMIDKRYAGDNDLEQEAMRGYSEAQKEVLARWMEINAEAKNKADAGQKAKDAKKAEREQAAKAKADKKAARDAKKASIKPRGKKGGKKASGDVVPFPGTKEPAPEADDPNGPVN